MMGGRTSRAQIVAYVNPALDVTIDRIVAAYRPTGRRVTKSSVAEEMMVHGLESVLKLYPLGPAHGVPGRKKTA